MEIRRDLNPADIAGMRVIEDAHLTITVDVKRSWRERLFSRPWRPWVAWKPVVVPDPHYYIIDGKNILPELVGIMDTAPAVVAHPLTMRVLLRANKETERP